MKIWSRACFLGFALSAALAAHDPWTPTDTAFQAACVAADLVDWHQTRELLNRPGIWEDNPILGHHPSIQEVDAYFAASILLGAAVSYLLPRPYRRIHQVFVLSLEGVCIRGNVRLGLAVRF